MIGKTRKTQTRMPDQLLEVKIQVLRFGRYLLTFIGLPAFVLNALPVWIEGGWTVFLTIEAIVLPMAVILAWYIKGRSLQLQALVLSLPVALGSVASIGHFGLSFGAGILQMGILSLLLVFFYSSGRAYLILVLSVLLADLALGVLFIEGWLPAPDLSYLDATDPANWLRIFISTAAAIPVTVFILARALGGLADAIGESEKRLEDLQAEQAEKEEAQKALNRAQRMDVVGRLASGLSHDFNNTLTLIRGSAELLQMDPDPDEVAELTDNIIRAADNAADLSRRLLIFSRQGETMEPKPVDPGAFLQRLGKSIRRLLPADIEVQIRSNATHPVRADPSQLDQAILNLCLNARDAMPEGGLLELSSSDRPLDDGAPGIMLQVRDSGTGMDQDTLARATEPFFTTKDEEKGTGLGLAMVKKMVDRHDGHLHMDSRLGLGSSVALHLPACTEGDAETTTVAHSGQAGGSILLVDDDGAVRRILARLLESEGYSVSALSTAGEAVALLDARLEFDLLVTDGVPQRHNTPPLIQQFLHRYPRGKVLVYSGFPRKDLLERGVPLGERVVAEQKPLPADRLIHRVSQMLSEA